MIFTFRKQFLIFLFAVAVVLIMGWLFSGKAVLAELSTQEQQAELQRQLAEIEAQIAQFQQELKSVQGEKNTLQNKINQLKKQQAALNLQIRSTTLQINNLADQIDETQDAIGQNKTKMERAKEQIGRALQLIYERDKDSFLFILLSQNDLSEILAEIENYTQLSHTLNALLEQTRKINEELNREEEVLSQQQEDTRNLLAIQNLQRQNLAQSASQQNLLLDQTKGRESNYQNILRDTQKRAQEIRQRLYQLLGVSDQITFGQAVEIAQNVSAQTGVRTAFLLAVLTQESNLGKNVGTCNRAGDPPSKSYKAVMHPTRDQPLFLQITAELGLDPDTTPISCPMYDSRGQRMGWGGAMGPAQFIPSTWMGYKARIEAVTGKVANPWDIRDAFIAAGIKLANDGATTVEGEWAAAMRYFSGSTNLRYRFYGDSVVAQAAKYQADIDELNQ